MTRRDEMRNVAEPVGIKAPAERAEQFARGGPCQAREEQPSPRARRAMQKGERERPGYRAGGNLPPKRRDPVERERDGEHRETGEGFAPAAARRKRGPHRLAPRGYRRDGGAQGIFQPWPHFRQRTLNQVPAPSASSAALPPESTMSNFA